MIGRTSLQNALGLAMADQALNNMGALGLLDARSRNMLKLLKPNIQMAQLLEMLEAREIEKFRSTGLSADFIGSLTPELKSRLTKRAIELAQFDLVQEMLKSGYVLSQSTLLEYLKENAFDMVRVFITENLLPESLELEFWYLCRLKKKELAGDLLELKPELANSSPSDALNSALVREEDELACLILHDSPSTISKEIVMTAIQHNNIRFLKVLWTGNYKKKNVQFIRSRKQSSLLWDKLEREVIDLQERIEFAEALSLSSIVQQLISQKKYSEVKEVLNWPGAPEEPNIIKVLIDNGEQKLASEVVRKAKGGMSKEDFFAAFEVKQFTLCTIMLKSKQVLATLEEQEVQKRILEILPFGQYCIQAIEMLNHIPNHLWHVDLTKQLISILNHLAKKSDELINCQAPLLFCALTAEFMKRLAGASLQHQNRCKAASSTYINLGVSLENAIKEEDILRYYLLQRDCNDRSALSIISAQEFYEMLEDIDIGTIVTKLWVGSVKHNGLFDASSLYVSLLSPRASKEAVTFYTGLNLSKVYMYQYTQWLDSCSLRFLAQALSTVILLVNYNILIYNAIAEDTFMDVAASSKTVGHLRVSQVWVLGIMVEHLLTFIFCALTQRTFKIDVGRKIDFSMFTIMLMLMLGLHESWAGEGNYFEDVHPEDFNAALHSLMMVLIWGKFFTILITSKRFGAFIRMIYLMGRAVLNFLLLFVCLIICFAAVFTSIFSNSSQYNGFNVAVRTLFSAAIGVFDFYAFSENEVIGGLLLGAYLLASNVLLLNLLVGLLTNIFSEVITRVDSEHRGIITEQHDRWSWDSTYGILIFMPSPFSYLVFLAAPFVLFSRNPQKVNLKLVKMFYVLYAIPQVFLIQAVSFISLPFVYLKAFTTHRRANKPGLQNRRLAKVLWTFLGVPYLLWAIVRDTYDICRTLYVEHELGEPTERTKAQAIVTDKLIGHLQHFLGTYEESTVHVKELVEFLINSEAEAEEVEVEELSEKKKLEKDFFVQFSLSNKNPVVPIEYIKKLLPKQSVYDDEYIERVQHIHLPWVIKGIKKFQESAGELNINGVNIPKEVKFYQGAFDHKHIGYFEQSLKEITERYHHVEQLNEIIKRKTEENGNIIQDLNN